MTSIATTGLDPNDHALEALLRGPDLSTTGRSFHQARTGIQRAASTAFGLSRRPDRADIPFPRPSGRGVDAGPDLGP